MAWGLKNISSKEITDWRAYYSVYPFREERADLRAAISYQLFANAHRPEDESVYELEAFLKYFDFEARLKLDLDEEDDDAQPDEDVIEQQRRAMLNKVIMWNAFLGGTDNRPKD